MNPGKIIRNLVAAIVGILIGSCSTIPEGAVAVKPFIKEKYLRKWYEIARFDFRFERNLNNTTAQYLVNDDGTIKVVNRGYNYIRILSREPSLPSEIRNNYVALAQKLGFNTSALIWVEHNDQ